MSLPPHTISAARQNLRRLVAIRYIALAGQITALLLFTWGFPLGLPVIPLAAIIALFGIINGFTHRRVRGGSPISDAQFCGQLLLDILALSLLLYFSGGATNPFVSYYLVPIIIGGIILPRKLMWIVTGTAITAYSLLFFIHLPLTAIAPHTNAGHSSWGMSLHVAGMWFNFFISALLIIYFVVRMAEELRRQQQALDEQHQQQLENEQLLAIATVAAGTAHELGTPLNTIKLLVDELITDQHKTKLAADSLQTIDLQIELCRDTLRGLTGLASDIVQPVTSIRVSHYIDDLLDTWQLLRPETDASIDITPPKKAVQATFHPVIRQALFNLFNNAADASPDQLEIAISWDQQLLTIIIRDHGDGLTTQQLAAIGQPMPSDKPGGLGLGLYLTNSSLSRHGGQVVLANAQDGGLITTVTLKLETVQA